jgi:hypothetical protein
MPCSSTRPPSSSRRHTFFTVITLNAVELAISERVIPSGRLRMASRTTVWLYPPTAGRFVPGDPTPTFLMACGVPEVGPRIRPAVTGTVNDQGMTAGHGAASGPEALCEAMIARIKDVEDTLSRPEEALRAVERHAFAPDAALQGAVPWAVHAAVTVSAVGPFAPRR